MMHNSAAERGEQKKMNRLIDIFTSPGDVFASLKDKPSFLLPVVLLVGASCAVIVWYYSLVDIPWLMERSFEMSQPDIPADQRAQMLEQASQAPRGMLASTSAIAVGVVVIVLLLAMGLYLTIVSMLTNDGLRFSQWFSLVSWASVPVVLSSAASLVNLAVRDATFLPAEQLNPLALANLLGLEVRTGFPDSLLLYVDPTSIWALVLMIVGYRQWTGKDFAVSALIVAAPLLTIIVAGTLLSM